MTTNSPILIVDDEPRNLAALEAILSDDYPLVFARNGGEAITAAQKHGPMLILLDIEMPDMNGYAVCRQLKADPRTKNIPVIFVSSLAEVGDEAAGFEVGAVDYIVKPVSPVIVSARVRNQLLLVQVTELQASYAAAIDMLGEAGHYNDTDTGAHIWRMAAYSRLLARAAGWSERRSELLEMGAPMHDTGKIGIPDSILKKPGKLDAKEWSVMKMHAKIGHDILSRSSAPIFQMAAEIALRHHERWDGSGYPDGLAGAAIPESARIVALADVFDALATKRPYKEAWPMEQVIATIKESSGKHFEPRLVEVFISILPQILDLKASWASRESAPEVFA